MFNDLSHLVHVKLDTFEAIVFKLQILEAIMKGTDILMLSDLWTVVLIKQD